MNQLFFRTEKSKFLENKNQNFFKEILALLSERDRMTIADLTKEIKLSIPKITTLVSELIKLELVADMGKDTSSGGRPPNVYGLKPDSLYFVGIDVRSEFINIGLTDFNQDFVVLEEMLPFCLENSKESLDQLCSIIINFIENCDVEKRKIQGVGLNLSGRVNNKTGYSYSFFHFQEDPLSEVLEKAIGYPVFLENDSRAMAYGEYVYGAGKGHENMLFLNLDYGIGMGIVVHEELFYGKSGYSGEIGHIPVYENNKICRCGKQGCLETEASGWALVEKFKARILAGDSSVLIKNEGDLDSLTMQQIIDAALKDDVLSIDLIEEIGQEIGRGLALLINIFNPELVVLGGGLSATNDYIRLPIKSAVNKLSLSLMNKDTAIRMAELGNRSGVIGASLLVRKRLLEKI